MVVHGRKCAQLDLLDPGEDVRCAHLHLLWIAMLDPGEDVQCANQLLYREGRRGWGEEGKKRKFNVLNYIQKQERTVLAVL